MTDKELPRVKTVAEERNVARAAEKLHIARPSPTRTLRRVEQRLDRELFSRGGNGVELTEAGRVVCEAAREMLSVYDAALKRVGALRRPRKRRPGARPRFDPGTGSLFQALSRRSPSFFRIRRVYPGRELV